MLVYKIILSLFTLLGWLAIMKDLGDFVALGEKLGLSDDKLFKFAKDEHESYLAGLAAEAERAEKAKAAEEERAERAHERELRLIERKVQYSDNERAIAEATGGGGTRHSPSPHVPSFKFSAFNEKSDDLDSWFLLFEKQCNAFGVKDRDKKAHLLSLFSGQYRDALLSLEADVSYDLVRAHLLQTFNLTKHDYRKKFFDIIPAKDENIVAFCQRLGSCFDKWVSLTKIEKDFKSLRDLILTHRVFETCNPKLKSFLVERDCNTLNELEVNATHFFNAHVEESLGKRLDLPYSANYASQVDFRGRSTSRSQDHGRYGSSGQRSFSQNGRFGRYENSRRYVPRVKPREYKDKPQSGIFPDNNRENINNSSSHARSGELICFGCGGKGHVKRVCPTFLAAKCTFVENWKDNLHFSVVTTSCNDPPKDSVFFKLPESLSTSACNSAKVMNDQHIYKGLLEIDGSMQPVKVLRDTGSMIHAIHKKFVKNSDYSGKTISLITFGGRKETFKLADIVIDTPFIKGKVSACVLDNYPTDFMYYDILVGNGGTLGSPVSRDPIADVIVKWETSHRDLLVLDDNSQVANYSSNDVFTTSQVQTRAQKQNESRSKDIINDKVLNFDISYTELANLQKKDSSLSKYFKLVNLPPKQTKTGTCSFEIRNDILVRLFKSDRYSLVQVMVPLSLRAQILSLGHDMPLSAHMGISRTLARVSSSFLA